MIKAQDMQVFEICDNVERTAGRTAKVNALRGYTQHQPLMYLLMWNFADHIKSLLPEGTPPFNDQPSDGPSKASLWGYLKLFPYFVASQQANTIKPLKRESMFIEMLNAVDPNEARLICTAKDRALTTIFPSITVDLVHEAFPFLNLMKTAPRQMTEEEIQEDIQAQITAAESKVSELREHVKALKAKLKK